MQSKMFFPQNRNRSSSILTNRPDAITRICVCLSLLISAGRIHAQQTPTNLAPTIAMVPMRDGVHLATDVYRDQSVERAPVVLMRTPYNKTGAKAVAERYAKAGYIAVVQDCRGKFASEGTFFPYDNEGQDGFDTIEWVVKQPWCNGRVGMWGASYVGATQWQAAAEHPPGLVTICPTATWSSFYRNLYLGGAVRLSLIAKWAGGNASRPNPNAKPIDWDAALMKLPLDEIDDAMGMEVPWLSGMLTHPEPGGYWRRVDLTDAIEELDLPMQHIVGYYDFFARESVGNFMRMQQRSRTTTSRQQQQLILGPWDHGTIGKSQVGEIDFSSAAVLDAAAENLKWFDRYLKQTTPNDTPLSAAVRYFSMGDNRWKEAATWPPTGYTTQAFFLHSHGDANTSQGHGVLNTQSPTTAEPPDQFVADPANPTPACPVNDKRPLHAAVWAPVDQRPIETRSDMLVYTSEPVTASPIVFAGNALAELYVSTDTVDADWVVRLIDVHPDGFSQNLTVGILRGRYRNSELHPELMKPHEVTKILVDLGPIAAEIQPGHRLRVDISGGYFPLFDRNPNTGEGPLSGRTAIATEKVYHQPQQASCILLPCKQ